MLSIADLRKLDPELRHLSDDELEQIRLALYDAAQLAFDVYVAKKRGSKCPVRSLASSEVQSKI
jgi:hypothetical protein